MHTIHYKKFKGEIENYVAQGRNIFESRIDRVFQMLTIKTQLNRSKIRKKDGYHPAHLLFILTLLPMLKLQPSIVSARSSGITGAVPEKMPFIDSNGPTLAGVHFCTKS
jgi:hypothetical protein